MRVLLISPSYLPVKVPNILNEISKIRVNAFKEFFKIVTNKADANYPSAKTISVSIGLLYIASVLLENGFDVTYLSQDYLQKKGTWEEEFKKNVDRSDIIAITSYTYNYPNAINILRQSKQINPEIISIIGGPHASFLDRKALMDGFDIVVRGEGETRMLSICKKISRKYWKKRLESIDGITFKYKRDIIRTPILYYEDLNKLPPPAYYLLEREILNNSNIPLFTSRGCPFRCTFCVEGSLIHKMRFRDPHLVAKDITYLLKCGYSNNIVFISDSIFGINIEHAIQVCKEIMRKNLNLHFIAQIHPKRVTQELIKVMKESGFIGIFIGIESCVNTILEKMKKGCKFKDYLSLLEAISNHFPIITASFIFGHPGETLYTSLKTIRIINWLFDKKLINDARPGIFVPFPGTLPFSHPHKFNLEILHKQWNQYHRHTFPTFRLKSLTEYQIWSIYLTAYSVVTRHISINAGIKDFINFKKISLKNLDHSLSV